MEYIEHTVGEMVDLVQRCVICGMVIQDLNGVMMHPAPKPGEAPPSWAPGQLFISKAGNPTYYVRHIREGEDTSELCINSTPTTEG